MALTPIQVFNTGGSSLASLFAGGTNTLTNALNNVIQIGRDQANRQFQQERDFLGEQRAEINLAQRRAENEARDFRTDRSFDRGLLESDRNFIEGRSRYEDQQTRLDASDLFRSERAAVGDAFREREVGIREGETARLAAERDAEAAYNRDLAQGPGLVERGTNFVASLFGGGSTPQERQALAVERARAAQAVRDPEARRSAISEAARAEAEARSAGGTGRITPAEERARNRERRQIETQEIRQDERRMSLLVNDRKAFPTARAAGTDTEEKLAMGREYAKNRLESETNFALNNDRETYIGKGANTEAGDEPLTPAERAKRGEFWDLVRKHQTGFESEDTPAAAPAAPSQTQNDPVLDWLNPSR